MERIEQVTQTSRLFWVIPCIRLKHAIPSYDGPGLQLVKVPRCNTVKTPVIGLSTWRMASASGGLKGLLARLRSRLEREGLPTTAFEEASTGPDRESPANDRGRGAVPLPVAAWRSVQNEEAVVTAHPPAVAQRTAPSPPPAVKVATAVGERSYPPSSPALCEGVQEAELLARAAESQRIIQELETAGDVCAGLDTSCDPLSASAALRPSCSRSGGEAPVGPCARARPEGSGWRRLPRVYVYECMDEVHRRARRSSSRTHTEEDPARISRAADTAPRADHAPHTMPVATVSDSPP